MNSDRSYQHLLTAAHIYLACHYECYINYNQLGVEVFKWMLPAEDLKALRLLSPPAEFKFSRVAAYESQLIAQELQLPATLVHMAFMEVITNEHNRTTGLSAVRDSQQW